MASREELESEIATLEGRLLTEVKTEFPDVPSIDEAILVNAYLVLAHGCVEEYVEALFQDYADGMVICTSDVNVTRAVAMAAFAWYDTAKSKPFRERTLDDVLRSGTSRVQKAVQANHGIKESNIESLARAAGVEWPPFESSCNVALTQLETLGGKRGSVAHVSTARTHITSNPVYPSDVKQWVADAVAAAQVIDDYLSQCHAPAARS